MTIIVSPSMRYAMEGVQEMILPHQMHQDNLDQLNNILQMLNIVINELKNNIKLQFACKFTLVNQIIRVLNKFMDNFCPNRQKLAVQPNIVASQKFTNNKQYDRLWSVFNQITNSSESTLVEFAQTIQQHTQTIYESVVALGFFNIVQALEYISLFQYSQKLPSINLYLQSFLMEYFISPPVAATTFTQFQRVPSAACLQMSVRSRPQSSSTLQSPRETLPARLRSANLLNFYNNRNKTKIQNNDFYVQFEAYLNANYENFARHFYSIVERFEQTSFYADYIQDNKPEHLSDGNTIQFIASDRLFMSMYCQHSVGPIVKRHFEMDMQTEEDRSIAYVALLSTAMRMLRICQQYVGIFNIEEGAIQMEQIVRQEEEQLAIAHDLEEGNLERIEPDVEVSPAIIDPVIDTDSTNMASAQPTDNTMTLPQQLQKDMCPADGYLVDILNDKLIDPAALRQPGGTLDADQILPLLKQYYLEKKDDDGFNYINRCQSLIDFFTHQNKEMTVLNTRINTYNQCFNRLFQFAPKDRADFIEHNDYLSYAQLAQYIEKCKGDYVQLKRLDIVDTRQRLQFLINNVNLDQLEEILRRHGEDICEQVVQAVRQSSEISGPSKPHEFLFSLMATIQYSYNNMMKFSVENKPEDVKSVLLRLDMLTNDLFKLKYHFTNYQVCKLKFYLYHCARAAYESDQKLLHMAIGQYIDIKETPVTNNKEIIAFLSINKEHKPSRMLNSEYMECKCNPLDCPEDMQLIVQQMLDIYVKLIANCRVMLTIGDKQASSPFELTVEQVDQLPYSEYEFFNLESPELAATQKMYLSQFCVISEGDVVHRKASYVLCDPNTDIKCDVDEVYYNVRNNFQV